MHGGVQPHPNEFRILNIFSLVHCLFFQAVNVLKEHGVKESSIILSNLFCTPAAAKTVVTAFPDMKILTSELHPIAPNHFGQRYFGTD